MKNKKLSPIGIAVGALVLFIVFFVVRGALHHPARIVLPQDADVGAEDGTAVGDGGAGRVVVRADTVQSAIATLARPTRYTRSITIERYYDGGSGVDHCTVSVDDGWTRADTERSSGEVSHTITSGERVWRWYGSGTRWFESAAAFSADEEQGIPTYEDVLAMDASRIALADYRLLDSVDCIYVETSADADGYRERYWISVSTGLLCASEKLCGEEVIYRMAGMTLDTATLPEDAFTLPDGTVLHESGTAGSAAGA